MPGPDRRRGLCFWWRRSPPPWFVVARSRLVPC